MDHISKWIVALLFFAACSAEAPIDGEDVGGDDADDADASTDVDASPSEYDSPLAK